MNSFYARLTTSKQASELLSVLRFLRVSVVSLIEGSNSPRRHREHGEKLKLGHHYRINACRLFAI